jgi:sugar phosphate isomerase/epimerase
MEIKFSIRESMAPGRTITERFENLAKMGFAGVEILTESTDRKHVAEIKAASKATDICPNIFSSRSLAILDVRRSEREAAVAAFKEALSICGECGGVGVILPPLISVMCMGGQRIPDLSPLATTAQLERDLLTVILKDLANHAQQVGADVIIEPLNRYEQWWPCTLQHGIDICEAVGEPGISIMADFFHMNIEDAHFDESIRRAGKLIKNVHLADSQRLLPGHGHTDFRPGLQALAEIGYDDYMGFECGIPGDPFVELPKSMDYLRGVLA